MNRVRGNTSTTPCPSLVLAKRIFHTRHLYADCDWFDRLVMTDVKLGKSGLPGLARRYECHTMATSSILYLDAVLDETIMARLTDEELWDGCRTYAKSSSIEPDATVLVMLEPNPPDSHLLKAGPSPTAARPKKQ